MIRAILPREKRKHWQPVSIGSAGTFSDGVWSDIVGVAIGIVLIGYEVVRRRVRVTFRPAGTSL